MSKPNRTWSLVGAMPEPLCSFCRERVCVFPGEPTMYDCSVHGTLSDISGRRIVTTSLGKCIVIARTELLDEDEMVMGCALPWFVEEEFAAMTAETPAERAERWKKRKEDTVYFREFKAAHKGWTIYSPYTGPDYARKQAWATREAV
jgi:hypothetical protein